MNTDGEKQMISSIKLFLDLEAVEVYWQFWFVLKSEFLAMRKRNLTLRTMCRNIKEMIAQTNKEKAKDKAGGAI